MKKLLILGILSISILSFTSCSSKKIENITNEVGSVEERRELEEIRNKIEEAVLRGVITQEELFALDNAVNLLENLILGLGNLPELTEDEKKELEKIKEEAEKEMETYYSKFIDIDLLELDQLKKPVIGETIATIKTTKGNVVIKFLDKFAPLAVENFITHSKNGYYDGLKFHRVIEDFVIQSGDPLGTGIGGESIWNEPFENETGKGAHHFNGALAMANSGEDTNGSQFYIVTSSRDLTEIVEEYKERGEEVVSISPAGKELRLENLYPEILLDAYKEKGGVIDLDYKYTVFGQVIEGYDIVQSISKVEVDEMNMPLDDVIIKTVEISTYE